MTDARLRALARQDARGEGDPGVLLRATLRAGEEPSLDLLARAADAAGQPRPVLWLCMQRRAYAERFREVPSAAAWHRVSVSLDLVAQVGRTLDAAGMVIGSATRLREVRAAPDGHPYVARLPLRSPCGSLSADVSEVRVEWRAEPAEPSAPGPAWCARCTHRWDMGSGFTFKHSLVDQAPLERALGLALAVPHPWDRRCRWVRPNGWRPDAGALPPWVHDVAFALADTPPRDVGWLYHLAAARTPLEGAT